MSHDTPPFWKSKSLAEMNKAEWESLCDGCGKCCLTKFMYQDSDDIEYTNIACKLLDHDSCRCKNYPKRKQLVPECVVLTPENVSELNFMPSTCAYRLLAEGKELEWWHPLVSGNSDTVHEAGISVRGRVVCETEVDEDDLLDHIVDWPK